MKSDTDQFATLENVQAVLRRMYPDAKRIEVVESGYDNIVGLVDETYAVRFPRNSAAERRSSFEEHILSKLASLSSVAIPKILSRNENPICLVTSFIAGTHLSNAIVKDFPHDLQVDFGRSVAKFAYELHSLLSPNEVGSLREELKLSELEDEDASMAEYLKRTLHNATRLTKQQIEIAEQYYQLWQQQCVSDSHIAIHDDLHMENMLFQNGHLVGVLDFGDTNVGTPEQELRQLYRINETVLVAAIEEYNRLSGLVLDLEAAKIWAITQEIAVYTERLTLGQMTHPSFERALGNLMRWLPEGNWDVGAQITDHH